MAGTTKNGTKKPRTSTKSGAKKASAKKPAAGKTAAKGNKTKSSASGGIAGSIGTLQKKLKPKLKGTPWLQSMAMNYFEVLKKYFVMDGRAGRYEFWMFVLSNLIVVMALGILSAVPILGWVFRVVSSLYGLAVFIPGFTVGVRRLHDTNRSGWAYLLMLIPLVGWIIVLVFCVLEGTSGSNKYGPDPKA